MKYITLKTGGIFSLLFILGLAFVSCEGEYPLPEAGSIEDATLPRADFSASQSNILEDYRIVTFTNQSVSSTDVTWDFGTGDTSTESNPTYTFEDGEGTYSVTMTVSDKNGESDAITKEVEVIEPEEPDAPDPVLVNFEFDKLPKSSGSDCSCAAWINKSIGEQGESSSGNGGSDNVVKFDNNEPDHVYQEFEVLPNQDYTLTLVTSFKSLENNTPPVPSMLEVRVLAGSGYVGGYTPVYYTETTEFPQDDWGYNTVAQVEDAANNLVVEVIENPSDEEYMTHTYIFNSGENTSLALFIRGIGGAAGGDYDYNSGDEEIRADYVTITAIN
jgi:PKD repeat protein